MEATMQDTYEVDAGAGQRDPATTPRRAIGTTSSRCILETDEDGAARSPVRTANQGGNPFAGNLFAGFDFAKAWGDAGIALEFGESLTDAEKRLKRVHAEKTQDGRTQTGGSNRTGEASRQRAQPRSPSRESQSYGSQREGRPRQQGRTSREASLSGRSDSRASTISMSRSQYSAISSSQDSTYSAHSARSSPSLAPVGEHRPKETVGRWQPSSGPSRPPGLERSQTHQPRLDTRSLGAPPGLNRDAAPFNPHAGRPPPRTQPNQPPGMHARANTDMGPIHNTGYGKDPMKDSVAANTRKNTVFVKGFDYEVSKDILYKYFSSCGDISNIALPRCRKRGRSRRLAWITFDSAEAVEAALRCDGSVLNTDPKRVLQISIAQPPRPKSSGSSKDEKNKAPKKRGRSKQQHPSLIIGDVVLLDLSREGVVKYIGTVRFAPGEWIGIELNNHSGKHNGVINGYRYFQCSNNKGIFVKRNRIRKKIGHDPQVSRGVQFGPTYETSLNTNFGYRKKVHSRNVSLMDSNSLSDEFPELRSAMNQNHEYGAEVPQSRPTSSKIGPPFKREFGARFTRATRDGPFGRPPAGFGTLQRPRFPPYRNNNNQTLSGPPPHPPNGRQGLTIRRPMPAGPPSAFDMSHFVQHLGPPGPGPSRGPNRSPPGIQPRSLSGVVSLEDSGDDTNGRDLSPPRASPEVGPRKPPGDETEPTNELMVSG